MKKEANYLIYNASAGSGKTYGLVKSLLKIILKQKHSEAYRSLLAITFTNKAVFEMKNRLIGMLTDFAKEETLIQPSAMFTDLCQELTIAPTELQQRAKNALMQLLHNYAALSISTIDGFNQRLIRNFAFDLRLNQFFEIQLDSDSILKKATDNLIERAGDDAEITNLLTEFAKDKIDEDKNWDSTAELFKVAKMLTVENHFDALNSLKEKKLTDFINLKQNLTSKIRTCQLTIQKKANEFLQLATENGLDEKAFTRGLVYNFFLKISQNPINEPPSWERTWQKKIETEPLYPKSNKKIDTDLMDSLQPIIANQFFIVKENFINMKFYRNVLQTIVPLALLNRLQNEIELIKEDENILPIWEFNGVISEEISSQPAPFIYERIGEKYRHYFIDEFQDTSVLQWKNFIPLILNAVQSESNSKQRGSVLLVGDAKQSIYRWRGGKAEQFMDLYLGEENPFFVKGEVHDLVYNYRSLPAIIDFNNAFFAFVSQQFTNEKYRKLYANSGQKYPESKIQEELPQGYISVRFVNKELYCVGNQCDRLPIVDENLSEINRNYCLALWEVIEETQRAGVPYKDICILVRKNTQASIVASFLTSNNLKVSSSESLRLESMPSVRFVVALLACLLRPNSEERRIQMLFEYICIKKIPETNAFLSKYTKAPLVDFLNYFGFSWHQFNSYSFYEGVAYIIKVFKLAQPSDAYLTCFLDVVFEFKNNSKGGIADFLEYWEEQKDKLSVSSPEGLDAITIMTVHKSKGLSAPVIIFAFADSILEGKKSEMMWYPVNDEDFSGFSNLLVNYYKNIEYYQNDCTETISTYLEQYLMDEMNVLYVAMTRPESFLYIISQDSDRLSYGSLLRAFVEKNTELRTQQQMVFSYGTLNYPSTKSSSINSEILPYVLGKDSENYLIAMRSSMLWGSAREISIERGNVIHELLARIEYSNEVDFVLQAAVTQGKISKEQSVVLDLLIKKLIHHPILSSYYTSDFVYYKEREFINNQGEYFRPDRIAFNPYNRETIIIDYKTGIPHTNHQKQLDKYAYDFDNMGWRVIKKYIVYLQENDFEVVEIS